MKMICHNLLFLALALLLVLLPCNTHSFSFMASTSSRIPDTSSNPTATSVPPAPQLLQFTEPTTNVSVVLVGSMHYNPSSVKLAEDTITSLAEKDMLGSVVVESCDIRWNKTRELYDDKPLLKKFLNNEMRTACDVAVSFDRPVVLGDQRINITSDALKANLKQTALDLITPPTGWKRFGKELGQAWDETVPFGGSTGYLNAFSFLDPRLLLVLPISLLKYPLSFLVRDPLPTSIAMSILFAFSYYDDPMTMDDLLTGSVPISDYVLSVAIAVLETVVFARLLLKPLLAERNVLLAQSILEQCRIYGGSVGTEAKTNSGWFDFLSKPTSAQRSASEIIYAPESQSSDKDNPETGPKVVVAVLGMAHCNGIMKLLKESRI
ncbi:MAG: hypothetical protein SGILL_009892 [Bacillariaceae sp.]